MDVNLAYAIVSYLLGSIPFGYLVAKAKKIDITKIGSGNIGATNVYRALGIWYALLVAFLDIAKAFVPAYFFGLEYGLFALLGHCYSIFLRFRGGKAVSTFFGLLLAMALKGTTYPLVVFLLVFSINLYITGIVSISSLNASLATLLASVTISSIQDKLLYLAIAVAVIFIRHRSNIERLMKGEEKPVIRR